MYLELRFIGEYFPHHCPRIHCAICRWLAEKAKYARTSKKR